jgi:hypothetical protein
MFQPDLSFLDYKSYWDRPRTDGDTDCLHEKASIEPSESGGFDSTGNFLVHLSTNPLY